MNSLCFLSVSSAAKQAVVCTTRISEGEISFGDYQVLGTPCSAICKVGEERKADLVLMPFLRHRQQSHISQKKTPEAKK